MKNYLIDKNIVDNKFVSIKKIVEKSLALYSPLYPSIKVKNNLDDRKIYINEIAFSAIIDNLISNAFKYNKKGGYIKVYLDKSYLVIEDNGIGIKDTEKIFDRFYKENERGIGIGLSIVKKLCEELKIDIKVSSNSNGTKIKLDLSRYLETSS
jgi:two-component system OmpR family sensor kinase